MLEMRRRPNRWVWLHGPLHVPFILWDLQVVDDERHEYSPTLNLVMSMFDTAGSVRRSDSLTIEEVLAIAAVRFQARGNKSVLTTLTSELLANWNSTFSYPALEMNHAQQSGNLALVFLRAVHTIARGGTAEPIGELLGKCLHEFDERAKRLGPFEHDILILIEARQRGIPFRRHSSRPTIQLGYGAKLALTQIGVTNRTGSLAREFSKYKQLAIEVLGNAGLPVPRHIVVTNLEQAKQATASIQFPLVVKPTSTDFGKGVTVGVRDFTELETAFRDARKYGSVLIEELLPGTDFRFHILDGKCIYVTNRLPPSVIGNGVDPIEVLVAAYAKARSELPGYGPYASASISDEHVLSHLAKQNLGPKSVLEAGRVVALRENSNVSTGGTFRVVTPFVHKDNIIMAERAARVIGLDNAGLDFISPDISRSWHDIAGGICEINASPGPGDDMAYGKIIDYLLPDPLPGRIPLVVLVGEGDDAKELLSEFRSELIQREFTYGLLEAGKLEIGSREGVFSSRSSSPQALMFGLLSDPGVEVAAIQVSTQELTEGLDVAYVDLLVWLEPGNASADANSESLVARANSGVVLTNPSVKEFNLAVGAVFDRYSISGVELRGS